MKRLELTDDLMTGIDEIDKQHRELFARGNGVLFPEAGRASVKDVINALLFLIHYVDEHFSDEERLMEYYGYDRASGHSKQHQRLRRDVEDLYQRTERAGTFEGLASELYYLFNDWYTYHIKEWDRAYAVFLQKRGDLDLIMVPGLEDVDDSDVEVLKADEGFTPDELETLRKLRRNNPGKFE